MAGQSIFGFWTDDLLMGFSGLERVLEYPLLFGRLGVIAPPSLAVHKEGIAEIVCA
jgi:hypothetical protein